MSAVIYKSVNSFLKHTLFVSNDDIRSVKFYHSLETVVSVDNASVEIVQVGSCISAAVEHDHRAKIGRNYGNDVKYHPFGLISRKAERLDYLESLYKLDFFLSCRQSYQFIFQIVRAKFEIILPLNVRKFCKMTAFVAFAFHRIIKAFGLFAAERDLAHFNKAVFLEIISRRVVLVKKLFDSLRAHFGFEIVAVLFEI